MTPGVEVLKVNEGKKKANSDLVGFGEPSKYQLGFKAGSISSDSPNKMGLFKQGTSSAYEGPTSIKAKNSWQDLRQLQHFLEASTLEKGLKQANFLKLFSLPLTLLLKQITMGSSSFSAKQELAREIQVKGRIVTNPSMKRLWRSHLTVVLETNSMGNRLARKPILVFQPTRIFNLLVRAEVKKMGVLEHCLMRRTGRGQLMELVKKTVWILLEVVRP